MRDMYFRIISGLVLLTITIAIFVKEITSRSFLCFTNGKCVTAWETGKSLIIISGKYYGLFIPKEYVEVLDSGAGGYGASVYLSKNPKYEFVIFSSRVKNFSTNNIMIIAAENDVLASYKDKLNINAIKNENYDISVGGEVIGSGTVIEKWKNGQKVN